ncbi:Tf2-8 [Senna tora]|uniref:Tf2-8 n=1 Tax=Senna tora TaxID=362788 RepID=A0A834THT3_9FABA|nr:Tf2-8 [Senna tora]
MFFSTKSNAIPLATTRDFSMANKDDVASGGGGQRIKDPTINAMQHQLKVFLGKIRDWTDSQGKRIASSQISQPKSRRHNRRREASNNGGEIEFAYRKYCDEILCDVRMHVGHILLGRPWELDRKAKKNRNLLMCSLKKFHLVYHPLEELNIKSISFGERQLLIISL